MTHETRRARVFPRLNRMIFMLPLVAAILGGGVGCARSATVGLAERSPLVRSTDAVDRPRVEVTAVRARADRSAPASPDDVPRVPR